MTLGLPSSRGRIHGRSDRHLSRLRLRFALERQPWGWRGRDGPKTYRREEVTGCGHWWRVTSKGKGGVGEDPGFWTEPRWRGTPLGEIGDTERSGLRG